jgi:hypothetical protein
MIKVLSLLSLLLLILPSLLMGFNSNIKSLSLLSKTLTLSHQYRSSLYRLYSTTTNNNDDNNNKCKIVFLGTPDVAAESLQIFIDESKKSNLYNVVAVVTQPPAPAGNIIITIIYIIIIFTIIIFNNYHYHYHYF